MIKHLKIKISFLFFGLSFAGIAQVENDVFIHDNAIYKTNSNWVTLGVGYGYNPFQKVNELAGSLILHAQVKEICLMTGYHLFTDESFVSRSYHSMTNFSFGAGLRKESLKTNMAAFIGPLYAYGKKEIHDNKYYLYSGLGFFINLEYSYKKFYDVGIGTSLFYNFSSYYQVVGIKLHIYFSGAFKTGINQPKIN